MRRSPAERPFRSIFVLTGAGISKESGLDTFRDADGIWSKVDLEDVATPRAFRRNPDLVQRFYNDRRRQLLDPAVRPNAAHLALASLETRFAGEFTLVTQNIDDLHERAGSRRLIHMHGEMLKGRCTHCGRVRDQREDILVTDRCSECRCEGTIRPHVVWFGEVPFEMERIFATLAACDLFVAVGTSGNVHPAAGFVLTARSRGAHTVELNLETSETSEIFHEHHVGKATEVVPAFVERLLA
jgi:NAD-dependent protein deacetylase/lipoamidase